MVSPDTSDCSPEAPRGQEGLVELGGKTYKKARLITSGAFDPREDLQRGHRVFIAGQSQIMYPYGVNGGVYSKFHASIKEAVLDDEKGVILQDHSLTFMVTNPFGYEKGFYWAPPCEDRQLDNPSIAINDVLDRGNYDEWGYETRASEILVLEGEVIGGTSDQVFSPGMHTIVKFLDELFDEDGHADYEEMWELIRRREDIQYAARRSALDRAAAKLAAAKRAAIEGAVGRD